MTNRVIVSQKICKTNHSLLLANQFVKETELIKDSFVNWILLWLISKDCFPLYFALCSCKCNERIKSI